jgi:hypothetical protein
MDSEWLGTYPILQTAWLVVVTESLSSLVLQHALTIRLQASSRGAQE